ncbi:MAG: hypothetical protein ACRDUW_05025 [Pseudonocardiaceae bacterium]
MAESWQVVDQRQSSILRGGSFQDAMVVVFTTASGVTGSVTVPTAQYTPDNVAKLISEKVAQIDAVHTLKSSSPPSFLPGSSSESAH